MTKLIKSFNELDGLTNIIKGIENSLGSLGQSTDIVDDSMRDLTRSTEAMSDVDMSALEDGMEDIDNITNNTRETITEMSRESKKFARIKVSEEFQKLKNIVKIPINKVTEEIKRISKIKLGDVPRALKTGFEKTTQICGKLLSGLKKIVKVSFKGMISSLNQIGKLAKKISVEFSKNMLAGIKKVGKGIASLSKKFTGITKKMGTALLGIGVGAIKTGMDFDSSMSQVAATMGYSVSELHDPTTQAAKDFEMLNNVAREQGKNTKFSAGEAGDALNYLALAGYNAEKAAGALPTVLTLATASGMELAATSDMITDSMSALGIEATEKNLTQFGDQLAKTAQKSNTSVEQLGNAILTVGGTAKTLNGATQELKNAEMNTALGILADSGIKGSEGGTKLRNIINSLTPTTKPAIEAFDELKISAYDAAGKMRPLEDTFTELTQKMGKMTDEQQTVMLSKMFNKADLKAVSAFMAGTATNAEQLATSFNTAGIPVSKLGVTLDDMIKSFDATQNQADFTKKAMKDFGIDAEQAGVMYEGLMSVTQKEGNNRWQDLKNKILDSDGAMKDMADTMNDNLKGRLTELGSATSEVGIALTRGIMEPMKDTVKEITSWMADLGTATDKGGIDGFFKGLKKFSTRVINLLNDLAPQGMEMVVKFMDSLLTGLEKNTLKTGQTASKVVTTLIKGFLNLVPRFIVVGAKTLSKFLEGIAKNIPQLLEQGKSAIEIMITGIVTQLPKILSSGTTIIVSLLQGITNMIPNLVQNAMTLIPKLMQGLLTNLPLIIQAGMNLLMSLIQGIITMLPMLIQCALQLIQTLVQSLAANLPTIIQTGITLLLSLIQGIVSMLPMLIQMALQLIVALVQGLLLALPQIIIMGVQIIISLIQGIVAAIPMIIQTVLQLIPVMIQTLISNLPLIIDMGIELLLSLIDGLMEAIPQLIASIPKIISAIIDSLFSTDWIAIGKKILGSIAKGLVGGVKKLFSFGKKAAKEVKDGAESEFSEETELETDVKINVPDTSSFILDSNSLNKNPVPLDINPQLNMNDLEITSYGPGISQIGQQSGLNFTNGYANGITSGKEEITQANLGIKSGTINVFEGMDMSKIGSNTTSEYTAGLLSGTQDVEKASELLSENTMFNLTNLNSMELGATIPSEYTQGLLSGTQTVTDASTLLSESAMTNLTNLNATELGTNLSNDYANGIAANKENVVSAVDQLSDEVSQVSETDVRVNIETDVANLRSFQIEVEKTIKEVTQELETLPEICNNVLEEINATITAQTNQCNQLVQMNIKTMKTIFDTGFTAIAVNTKIQIKAIKDIISSLNLFNIGQNIMNGLKNGIMSKRQSLLSAAQNIASDIVSTINKELDIHSPSRVLVETGKNVVLGAVKGIEQNKKQAEEESISLGSILANGAEEGVDYYTSDNNTYNNTSSNVTNHYDANFTLNMQGGDNQVTERKVKKWMKESIQEYFKSMGRVNPRVSEV